MSSSTPNIGLTLPTGGERVSRQIINENNTKIDTYAGELSEQIGTVDSNAAKKTNVLNFVTYSDITGASLDSITTEGIYHNWFRDGTPFDNSWGVMFVINRSNVMEQIIINQGGIAKRHYESGSWSSWKKVSFT